MSFDSFHDQLAQYGDWVYSDRWGEVWQPADVPDDFRPYYTDGHWAYTDDYGWIWQSDYEWGDIPFHYGRWVNDPDDGWLWIAGYTWSPGWVVWRGNDRYTGWMPMPPDDNFMSGRGDVALGVSFGNGGGVSVNFGDTGDYYGYSRWYGRDYGENQFASNWIFVGTGHIADDDYRSYAVNRGDVVNIIHQTRNVTNYTVINNYVVNKSIDVHAVETARGRPIQAVRASEVIKRPGLITTVAAAQEARKRQTAPRGTGLPNSAPKPSAAVIRTLSPKVVEHGGKQPSHLFTKTTVTDRTARPEVEKPRGANVPARGPAALEKNTTQSPSGTPTETPAERVAHPSSKPLGRGESTSPAVPSENGETPTQRAARMRQQQPQTQPGARPASPTPDNTSTPADRTERMRQRQLQENGSQPSAAPATEGQRVREPLQHRPTENPNTQTSPARGPAEEAPMRQERARPVGREVPPATGEPRHLHEPPQQTKPAANPERTGAPEGAGASHAPAKENRAQPPRTEKPAASEPSSDDKRKKEDKKDEEPR